MMFVFWWTGRGYLTMVLLLASLIVFGLIAAMGAPDGPPLWGMAFATAAALNWYFGSKINHKKRKFLKPKTLRGRLFYRANHRFMSMPMESFSVALAAIGLAIIVMPYVQ